MSHAARAHLAAREAVAGADRALRAALADVERCRAALSHALREETRIYRLVEIERQDERRAT
jgi:hypothetical protein